VLRLASLLWRLRRATKLETGLFEIQTNDHTPNHALPLSSPSRGVVDPPFGCVEPVSFHTSRGSAGGTPHVSSARPETLEGAVLPAAELAYCFLRLANLPSFALDRLTRYETNLWRQVGQTLLALDALDRRKPQERKRGFRPDGRQRLALCEPE
jgi:hypothetical protein